MNNVPVGTCVRFDSMEIHLQIDIYHTLRLMGIAHKSIDSFYGTLVIEKGEDNEAILHFNDPLFTIDAHTYDEFISYYGEAK